MSVIMMLRVQADVDAFERYAAENSETLERVSADGREKGAIHQFFAAGDGELVVIDEWPDEASFQGFFEGQTEIPGIMQAAGATGEPQVTFFRKLETSDQF
jgi:hypothetical protein